MRSSLLLAFVLLSVIQHLGEEKSQPFGTDFPNLDSNAVGQWWNRAPKKGGQPRLLVDRRMSLHLPSTRMTKVC